MGSNWESVLAGDPLEKRALRLGEVAHRAGVSPSTVSRVINGSKHVSCAKRKLVETAIQELKFQPNWDARSLAGFQSRSFGLILPNVENPFFLSIYRSIAEQALTAGYEVLMANSGFLRERLEYAIRSMIGRKVAAVAVIAPDLGPKLTAELSESGIPTVFFDAVDNYQAGRNIRINYVIAMERLAAYLYNLGHRRIGIVGCDGNQLAVRRRLDSAIAAFSRYPDVEVRTAIRNDSLEGGRSAAKTLLSQTVGLTAIVCTNDFMAVGAARAVRDYGLQVPKDISLAGFDDIDLASFCCPSLTSARVPCDLVSKAVWDGLIDGNRRFCSEIVIDPELVIRDSTASALLCESI